MSEPVALFFNAAISPKEFAMTLLSKGGVMDPKSEMEGQVSRGSRHVWVFLQSPDLRQLEEPIASEVTSALGGRPQTNLVMEISRHPGSDELAVELASAFAAQWPVVAHNLRVPGRIFTPLEIQRRSIEGIGFSEP